MVEPLHANALCLMAQRGETTAIQRAIDTGSDVNETAGDWFPLMMGVAMDQTAVVELLLQNKAKVDQTDEHGVSSLALAVQEGHVASMKLLLAYDADVNQVNSVGSTPLFVAAQTGNLQVVDALVSHGADSRVARHDGGTALHAAVRSGSTSVVERLLEAGADPSAVDDAGVTPLLAAIKGDIERPSNKGRSPSKQILREALVSIILSGGADVNQAPRDAADTAVGSCVDLGALKLLVKLLDHGADPNLATTAHGVPPLLRCAVARDIPHERQLEIARLLLDRGAHVDGAEVRSQARPLHAAVVHSRLDLVKLLLHNKADPNAPTTQASKLVGPAHMTPLRLATDDAVADELCAAGATEPCDDMDLATKDDMAIWVKALTWHDKPPKTLMDSTPFENDMGALVEDADDAKLWDQKLKRHARLQRDREQRAALIEALKNDEGDAVDHAETKALIVSKIRAAAAAHTRATILGADGNLHDIAENLESAVSLCLSEAERLRAARATCLRQRYEALSERWTVLEHTLEATTPREPEKLAASCPPGHSRFFLGPRDHLRVRAAAARPILYGALSSLLDAINAAPSAAQLGLPATTYHLPFGAFRVPSGQRAELFPQPTRPPENDEPLVSARVRVDDPYAMAVVIAALVRRARDKVLPLAIEAVNANKLRSRGYVKVVVAVEYPRTAEQHAACSCGADAEFSEAIAGRPLALASVCVDLCRMATIAAAEDAFAAVERADQRAPFLFSKPLAFLDPDTWQPKAAPALDNYHVHRARDIVADGNVASLERKLGEYSDALASARAALDEQKTKAASQIKDLNATIEQLQKKSVESPRSRPQIPATKPKSSFPYKTPGRQARVAPAEVSSPGSPLSVATTGGSSPTSRAWPDVYN